jgi:hypothetical protein
MPFVIKCGDSKCYKHTIVRNIVELIAHNRDDDGWFICSCGAKGYIEKSFSLQEEGQVWSPFLHGIITLGDEGHTYQPFVFTVGSNADGKTDSLWFSYYKDLRAEGGLLKLGYGPGGPPVLHKDDMIELLKEMIRLNILSKQELKSLL